ncbi:spore coat protein GerQ [Paenibacillus cymbidii]|uniref:spore coat protein GerQ n=1 Tax=Paenibacillus cymbidii TaxID=1639034 RepID=UPI001F1B70F8|nr:spore coat protein GerQ [Paenibacillus cymbidii]
MQDNQARPATAFPNYGYPSYPVGNGFPRQMGTMTYPAGTTPPNPSGSMIPGSPTTSASGTGVNVPGLLPSEQSYVENILRLNLGKVGTFYMTYENNSEWNAKIFKGRIEAAGRDHIVLSDPATGKRFLLLMLNLDYVTFDEPINYYYPLQPQPR